MGTLPKQTHSNLIYKFTAPPYSRLSIIFLAFLSLSCKREIIFTDTAEVKRIDAVKAALDLQRTESRERAAQDSLRTAEVFEQAAKASQMEQESKLALEKSAREKELAGEKKALIEEVTSIAAASDTIQMFVADLRFRQGRLELKRKFLPDEIEEARADAVYLTKILSSFRQGIVTNIRYVADGKAKLTDIQSVTLKPEEYVKQIKSDQKITRILTRYNNEMFAFELDKVIEELAYETRRLWTSWAMLQNGKTSYRTKQTKADTGGKKSSSEFIRDITAVENRIKVLEFSRRGLMLRQQNADTISQIKELEYELGKDDGAFKTGRYGERASLKRMLELSGNTGLLGDATDTGISANFDLSEKGIRDEYEANVRVAFNNVERTVLRTVTDRKDALEEELKAAQSDLAAIQLILDAHVKGRISRNDILTLHEKYTNSVSGALSSAADHILK